MSMRRSSENCADRRFSLFAAEICRWVADSEKFSTSPKSCRQSRANWTEPRARRRPDDKSARRRRSIGSHMINLIDMSFACVSGRVADAWGLFVRYRVFIAHTGAWLENNPILFEKRLGALRQWYHFTDIDDANIKYAVTRISLGHLLRDIYGPGMPLLDLSAHITSMSWRRWRTGDNFGDDRMIVKTRVRPMIFITHFHNHIEEAPRGNDILVLWKSSYHYKAVAQHENTLELWLRAGILPAYTLAMLIQKWRFHFPFISLNRERGRKILYLGADYERVMRCMISGWSRSRSWWRE